MQRVAIWKYPWQSGSSQLQVYPVDEICMLYLLYLHPHMRRQLRKKVLQASGRQVPKTPPVRWHSQDNEAACLWKYLYTPPWKPKKTSKSSFLLYQSSQSSWRAIFKLSSGLPPLEWWCVDDCTACDTARRTDLLLLYHIYHIYTQQRARAAENKSRESRAGFDTTPITILGR